MHTHDAKSTDDLRGLRCPACDYDLTGLREHRCPECGAEFDPQRLRAGLEPISGSAGEQLASWRSARFVFTMEALLIVPQMIGLAFMSTPYAADAGWLGVIAAVASVPIAVMAQPILLVLASVEWVRASRVGASAAANLAAVAAVLAVVGLLIVAAILSRIGDV